MDNLVVRRLDRLGRTPKGSINLFGDLVRGKVNPISFQNGLDLEIFGNRGCWRDAGDAQQW